MNFIQLFLNKFNVVWTHRDGVFVRFFKEDNLTNYCVWIGYLSTNNILTNMLP